MLIAFIGRMLSNISLKDTVEHTKIPDHHQATQGLLDFRPETRLVESSKATLPNPNELRQ